MARQKTAFTFVEAIFVVLLLGVLAAIAIPRLSLSATSKQKANGLAKKIVTDLRRTRRLAISNAATNTVGFKLNMTGSSGHTGRRPRRHGFPRRVDIRSSSSYTGYKIVDANSDETVDSQTIDSAISCTGGDEFQFGPLGNLLSGSDTQLTISADGKKFKIDITPATGMVKCTEN